VALTWPIYALKAKRPQLIHPSAPASSCPPLASTHDILIAPPLTSTHEFLCLLADPLVFGAPPPVIDILVTARTRCWLHTQYSYSIVTNTQEDTLLSAAHSKCIHSSTQKVHMDMTGTGKQNITCKHYKILIHTYACIHPQALSGQPGSCRHLT
jgi:hypothetical protein